MENTTGTGILGAANAGTHTSGNAAVYGDSKAAIKTRIVRVIVLILFTFVLSRGPLMNGCFPAAISFIAYMLSRSTLNIYLILPAAAGIIPYISKGFDPWGDVAAMCVCGLLFAAARRIRMSLWHRAAIAAAITIICISIYRLATGTVYKTSVEMLLLEALAVFCLVFVFHAFFLSLESGAVSFRRFSFSSSAVSAGSASSASGAFSTSGAASKSAPFGSSKFSPAPEANSKAIPPELRPVSLLMVMLMTVNGMMLSSLSWPVILFVALWFLTYADVGTALLVSAAGGVAAALMDQAQWGLLTTVVIGLSAAALFRRYGRVLCIIVFAAVCFALGFVESGIVLGIDHYCLFIASAAFFALQWKYSRRMGAILSAFTGKAARREEATADEVQSVLRGKMAEMEILTELYATYLDSRSILANQFCITRQILEDAGRRLGKQGRSAIRQTPERLQVDVAISQCAAVGSINGDCCGWQEIGDGKVIMVVSDGMGKGKKAAAESLMVTRTIMSLLKSGATADQTLKLINTVMLMKSDEDSYATVDLVLMDKQTGKTKFYKIGAAPTLIRRKSNVEEVKLAAVPLGIVNGLKIRYVETTLKKDDWIIMMSDGVSDGGSAGSIGSKTFLDQIKEAAADVRSADPQTMSDLLLNRAADSYIGRERDDMTVMVARVI